MYGNRVSVSYRRFTAADESELGAAAHPLPVVLVGGEPVLRGQLHIQVIAARLADMGVTPVLGERG